MNPGVLSGKPIIHGTRMPVWIIIESIDVGQTSEEIIENSPFLPPEDTDAVRFSMEFAPGRIEARKLSET